MPIRAKQTLKSRTSGAFNAAGGAIANSAGFLAALTGYDVPSLYALKGEIVARGVKAITGLDMPVFPKRRFQHGALPADEMRVRLDGDEHIYRRTFQSLYA